MPAPKDPEKYKLWIETLRKKATGRQHKLTEEGRKRLSDSAKRKKGVKYSNEIKARMSEAKRHQSEETRKKISIATSKRLKGKPGLMTGRKHSPETILKMKEVHKKEYLSDETRRKLSEYNKLYRHSEEAKKRISLANKGRKHNVSEETKRNISQANKNRVWSKEQREKAFERMTDYWLNVTQEIKLANFSKKYKNGVHNSEKSGAVTYRSSYELDFYKQLDLMWDVLYYEVEKISIPYFYKNKTRSYIPDIIAYFRDGNYKVYEVKPSQLLEDERNKCKFESAKKFFGDNYQIVTEKEIYEI